MNKPNMKMQSFSWSSADRDREVYPDASSYSIAMPNEVQRVREVRLGDVQLPLAARTVEKGVNDVFRVSEGLRVDVGEEPPVFPAGGWTPSSGAAPPLWNHQLLICEADETGAYTAITTARDFGANNFVLTVPAFLNEVNCKPAPAPAPNEFSPLTATSSFYTVPATGAAGSGAGAPHGLSDYRAWKQAAASAAARSAPDVVSVAACTFSPLLYSAEGDVTLNTSSVPPHNVPVTDPGLEYAFQLTDSGMRKLNAFSGPTICRSQSVTGSFIHCPALHAEELADFLSFAIGRRRTLNGYRFEIDSGRMYLRLLGPVATHGTGVSSAPRLFFRTAPNAVLPAWGGALPATAATSATAMNASGGTSTSLGTLLGFQSGSGPQNLVRGARKRPIVGIRGGLPPTCAAVVPAGVYDVGTLTKELANATNWGFFSAMANGTTPSSQLGFLDSTGVAHAVVIRAGKYSPFELAKAVEYAFDRLDQNGAFFDMAATGGQIFGVPNNSYNPAGSAIIYAPEAPRIGNVKYSVSFSWATARFTFACNRITAIGGVSDLSDTGDGMAAQAMTLGDGVAFGMTFDATMYPATAGITSDLAAATLGLRGVVTLSGETTYTGAAIRVPHTQTCVSQGPLNSATNPTRPLMYSSPGTANGHGAGPPAAQLLSNHFRISGTNPNTNQMRCSALQHPARGDLQPALRGSGESAAASSFSTLPTSMLQCEVVSVSDAVGGIITSLAVGPITSHDWNVGQFFYINQTGTVSFPVTSASTLAIGMVTSISKLGNVTGVTLVYRGSGYSTGFYPCAPVAPQGGTRVVYGATDDLSSHRFIVSGFHVTEAAPTASCLYVAVPDMTNAACATGARTYRTTTAPLGHGVGDVVRFQESEVLRTNSKTGEHPGGVLSQLKVNCIAATNSNALGPVGAVLRVEINTPGLGYVEGMYVALIWTAPAPPAPAPAPVLGRNSAIAKITAVGNSGDVTAVEMVYGGAGYVVWPVVGSELTCHTVMGPYPQTVVVTEAMNSCAYWIAPTAPPNPPLQNVELQTARLPRMPVASADTLTTTPVQAAAAAGLLPYAYASRGVDGATVRVRTGNNLFYNNDTNTNAVFAPFTLQGTLLSGTIIGQKGKPGNVDLFAAADPPRFEIFVAGEQPYTQLLPRSIAPVVGAGRTNLFGQATYLFPAAWNLRGVPFILMRLIAGKSATDFNRHLLRGGTVPDLLAKIPVGQPGVLTNTAQQLTVMGTGGVKNYSRFHVEFLTPDGTLYPFHGLEHTACLVFVFDQENVALTSL